MLREVVFVEPVVRSTGALERVRVSCERVGGGGGYREDEPERLSGSGKKEWKSTTCIQDARTRMRSIAMSRCHLFLFVR